MADGLGGGSPAAMAIVSTTDGTQVHVDLPNNGAGVAIDPRGRIRPARGVLDFTLDAHEVAYVQTGTNAGGFGPPPAQPDLSGARITSSNVVSVFSSHLCAFYPQLLAACDHLEEQLFPTGTLGKQYVLVPPAQRGHNSPNEIQYWKIVAAEGALVGLSVPFTDLHASPPGYTGVPDCADYLEPTGMGFALHEGDFCEFRPEPVQLSADGRIMVMGIMSGQESTGFDSPFGVHAGDPSIFLVPPDLQYRNDYAFLTPGKPADLVLVE